LKPDNVTFTVEKVLDYNRAVSGRRRSLNVLGVIVFCFVFGGVLASMGKEAQLLVKIFEALNGCCVKMIRLVMM
jgi:Na+/H+-dicarboxylate symporter